MLVWPCGATKSRIRPEGVDVAYDNGAMAAVATHADFESVKMALAVASHWVLLLVQSITLLRT